MSERPIPPSPELDMHASTDSTEIAPKGSSVTGRWYRFRDALGVLRICAALFILLLIVVSIGADIFGIVDPSAQDIVDKLKPVGTPGHMLGTDQFGRDIISRLAYGARVEFAISLGTTAVAMLIGTLLGLVGGFYGRWAETLTMRSVDVILAFPPIVLALLVVTIYGPGIVTLIFVMGLLFAPAYARLTYGQVLTVRSAEYVDASLAFGAGRGRTMRRVVLPNSMTPVIVQMPLTLAASILLESGLSYLGLGVVPPTPSWGFMVADGQRYMTSVPSLVLLPSLVIAATILAFGLVGDFLRDWLDPRRAIAKSS